MCGCVKTLVHSISYSIFHGSGVSCAQLGGACSEFLMNLPSNSGWGWSRLEVLTGLMVDAGCQLGLHWDPWPECLCVVWSSPWHGSLIPRATVPRKAHRWCMAFYDLTTQVIKHQFHYSYRPAQIQEERDLWSHHSGGMLT